jgi:hypothetical protein
MELYEGVLMACIALISCNCALSSCTCCWYIRICDRSSWMRLRVAVILTFLARTANFSVLLVSSACRSRAVFAYEHSAAATRGAAPCMEPGQSGAMRVTCAGRSCWHPGALPHP